MVAIGTELLLGQIVDTNSAEIGAALAQLGIDCHYQTRVGDNIERIASVIRNALTRSDAVITCGGLGPTQDDVTRESIAMVMEVPLLLDETIAHSIESRFSSRGRTMAANNLNQAMVPKGANAIIQTKGTAPGLVCPIGDKVIYAAPGVPYELEELMTKVIIPDLVERSGIAAVIVSRVIRTWGLAESTLSEMLDPIFVDLGTAKDNVTMAFLASGIEGIKVRLTSKAATISDATFLLDKYQERVLAVVGDYVFGYDDITMEAALGAQLIKYGLSLSVAESLTGGLVSSRLVSVAGASKWFRGGLISYASSVKYDVLGVSVDNVVTEAAALEMASGVRKLMGSDIGLSFTGVAGPEPMEGQEPGTVWIGIDSKDIGTRTRLLRLPGDRERIRQFSTISGLDVLRRFLQANYSV